MPSSASTQLNSTSTSTEAEVSLISCWSSHPPPGTVVSETYSTLYYFATTLRLDQDYFKLNQDFLMGTLGLLFNYFSSSKLRNQKLWKASMSSKSFKSWNTTSSLLKDYSRQLQDCFKSTSKLLHDNFVFFFSFYTPWCLWSYLSLEILKVFEVFKFIIVFKSRLLQDY